MEKRKDTLQDRWLKKERDFLRDIAVCNVLIETLTRGYESPYGGDINSSKVRRTRLLINDILKKY
jgi:hypothetical protein